MRCILFTIQYNSYFLPNDRRSCLVPGCGAGLRATRSCWLIAVPGVEFSDSACSTRGAATDRVVNASLRRSPVPVATCEWCYGMFESTHPCPRTLRWWLWSIRLLVQLCFYVPGPRYTSARLKKRLHSLLSQCWYRFPYVVLRNFALFPPFLPVAKSYLTYTPTP